jgi:acyl carrier protein
MSELEDQVIAFILEETGIKRKRVLLSSRLAQDIRLDGDDTVELFKKFGEKFNVDLTVLYHHWDQHFLPEGTRTSPGCLIGIFLSVAVGAVLYEFVKRIPALAWMMAVLPVFGWIYTRLFLDRDPDDGKIPITVQDLVDAARSGKWMMPYETSGILVRALP